MKYYILTCFIIICSFVYGNESFRLSIQSTNEGLSQQDVETIIQDKQGFLWIGTYDGLNKYDGNNFQIFRHNSNDSASISDNRILCLFESISKNKIWIGTDGGGLNVLDLETEQFTAYNVNSPETPLLSNEIRCIMQASDHELWIGYPNGLSRITLDNNDNIQEIESFLNTSGIEPSSRYITSIEKDIHGRILVGTRAGLFFLVKSNDKYSLNRTNFNASGIIKIVSDNDKNIWIITNDGLYFISKESQRTNNYPSSAQRINLPYHINSQLRTLVAVASNKHILVSRNAGLYWLKHNGNETSVSSLEFENKDFFINNSIKNALLDRTMNVWLTSGADGIAKFDLNEKRIGRYALPLPDYQSRYMSIQSLLKDSKGKMWIGTMGQGLFVENKNADNIQNIVLDQGMVLNIYEDSKKNIWLTTDRDIYNFANGELSRPNEISRSGSFPDSLKAKLEGPYAICEDEFSSIWIGLRKGLLRMTEKSGKYDYQIFNIFDYIPIPLSESNITTLAYSKQMKRLWIGTKNFGLFYAQLSENGDLKLLKKVIDQGHGKDEHIWSLHEDKDNNCVWVGTDNGLKRISFIEGDSLLYIYASNHSKISNYKILAITEDSMKRLWLSTSSGLFKFDPNTLAVSEYLHSDGLTSNSLTEGAFFDKQTGVLYIGSVNGINEISPNLVSENPYPAQIQFTGFKINNKDIKAGSQYGKHIVLEKNINFSNTIVLRHNENNFTVEFAALHYSNPSKNNISYFLEGFSTEWTVVSNTHPVANYTNIPPGKYKLLVKASNGDGVWGSEIKELAIIIKPAWWNTVWAYLCYSILFILMLFSFIYYLKRQQMLKKQLMIEQMEYEKDRQIAEIKLKFHTNITHEIRTPLTLITAPLKELLKKDYKDEFLVSHLHTIQNNADRLLQLISQFLDFRKTITESYPLIVSNNNIIFLLENIKQNFDPLAKENDIQFNFFDEVLSPICWFDAEIIKKVLYNLLSNAFKYTPNGGSIQIYAEQKGDMLLISVEDNGAGIDKNLHDKIFERFYQVSGSAGGTGIGLSLSKQLIELHKGTIQVKSEVGKGTCFTFSIPCTENYYKEEIVETKQPVPDATSVETTGQTIILIVEDNTELRNFIKDQFQDSFTVIGASNGKEGYDKALEYIPNLIISDVMMPEMDGYELTKKIKDNIKTSHIPVILLTAKISKDAQISGFTSGAEDYITKPFDPDVLKLKVNNLIKLTTKNTGRIEELPKLNEREQGFIDRFTKIVDENMVNPDFGIEHICTEIGVSRMQLYRKMQAILGKNPSQYIKELKMAKAKKLMEKKGYNKAETMNEIGYTNYTHFSNIYKEIYGEFPKK